MSSTLNAFQQTFCLSLVIDSAWDQKGDATFLETYLAGKINTLLENQNFSSAASWSLVWGPVVWQAPGSVVVDQAMAVCHNSATNTFHVAVSATNPTSAYDIFFEDLAVAANFMLPFPNGGPGTISAGNAAALQVLLAMDSAGKTLSGFLAGQASTSASVVISGHSLGGGLSPLLAYALFPTQASRSAWAKVCTYPTAGPSTADQAFATAYAAAFPVSQGTGYQMWNANQYNGYDIVPNAWSGANTGPGIAQISAATSSSMFYTDWVVFGYVMSLNFLATAFAEGTTGSNPYVATNYNLAFSGPRENGKLTSMAMLEEEVVYQHTVAYVNAFAVADLFPEGEVRQMIHPSVMSLLPIAAQTTRAAAAITAAQDAAERSD